MAGRGGDSAGPTGGPGSFAELNGSPGVSVIVLLCFFDSTSFFGDPVHSAKNEIHHFVGEEALAEFYGARERRDAIARIGRRGFDGAKHHACAIFGSGFGTVAAFVGPTPCSRIDLCVRTGF